jgi:2-dehydro-3-deoxyphosphogluconate aldolase/(4S)-4-hydroxy-2-oxoglutarate aldolase
MHAILEQLGKLRIVPILVVDHAEHAEPLGDALVAGGLPLVEITFRTDAAEETIRRLAKRDDLLVGAGTILSTELADRAIGAGAQFIVAPGTNPNVIEHCRIRGVPITPGIATPTDIELALSHGAEVLKFFPAENMGGVRMLKALAGPFPGVQFLPTGGITPEKLPAYLALPSVLACGGSWLAPREQLAAGDFAAIGDLVKRAAKLVNDMTRSPALS